MKLCAFDIDGTLIDDTMENGEFVVYPEVIAALNAFLDQGNPILLASGRSLPGLIQFAHKFHHPEHIYYSTSNGACLFSSDRRPLYSAYIPYSVFLKMARLYGGHEDWTYMCYAPGNVVGFVGKPNFAPEEARFNKMVCEDFSSKSFPSDYQIEKASMTTASIDAHTLPLYPELGDYQSYATSSFFFEIVAKRGLESEDGGNLGGKTPDRSSRCLYLWRWGERSLDGGELPWHRHGKRHREGQRGRSIRFAFCGGAGRGFRNKRILEIDLMIV
jgi:hydroxymethylpyrimidine pyrophosphatase-like HAD family hydrolase